MARRAPLGNGCHLAKKTLLSVCTLGRGYVTASLPTNQFSSVQLLSRVQLFTTPWTAARKACLSITNSQSLLMSTELVMPSNQLILCHPLLILPSIFPSIRVLSSESVLRTVARLSGHRLASLPGLRPSHRSQFLAPSMFAE